MKYFKNSNTKCRSCSAIRGCLFTAKMRALCGGPFKDKANQILFLKESIQKKGDKYGSYYHTVQVRRNS